MDADFAQVALLQHNFFPNHRTRSPELPPFIHSRFFTPSVADAVIAAGQPTTPYKGCDYVQYTLTRFNGGPRVCGIPHPYPYAVLVRRIHGDWARIEPQLTSASSVIKPEYHKDGRLFVMDYGSQRSKSHRYLNKQSCATHIAKADISNFYPSLYTHAVAWAIVGIDIAKQNIKNSLWYNALDRDVRNCRRGETNGVPIGPGTSSLVAEIVLSQVDRRLEKDFVFERFIDDYTCYAESREDASRFIHTVRAF